MQKEVGENFAVSERNLKVFGAIWALIFAVIAFKTKSMFPSIISLVFIMILMVNPQIFLRAKIYQNWIRLGNFLGKVNGFLISFVLFYGIFSVTGIVLRFLKKDLLCKKLDSSSSSYFIDRAVQPGDMKNQF